MWSDTIIAYIRMGQVLYSNIAPNQGMHPTAQKPGGG